MDSPKVDARRIPRASVSWREFGLVFLLVASTLYGGTYELWVRASPGDRITDIADYVAMSYGNYAAVPIQRRYRPLIPAAAEWVRDHSPLHGQPTVVAATLPFYVVNFLVMVAAALLVHLMLRGLGFDIGYSLLGVALFLGSRLMLTSAALPMVDAPYWLAIAAVAVLVVWRKPLLYAALIPLLALAKEPILPILLLPVLCERDFRRPAVFAGLAAGACTFLGQRWMVDHLLTTGAVSATDAAGATVAVLAAHNVWRVVLKLFTPWGFHDANSAFMALLPIAGVGWWMDRRSHVLAMPRTLFALIPLVVVYALLSGTLGRQLAAAFPIVIPYVVLVVWRLGETTATSSPLPPPPPRSSPPTPRSPR